MPTVAIAGGTSPGLGRSLITAILEAHPGGAWSPVILSRNTKRPLWLQAADANSTVGVRAVDYSDEGSIADALHGVHTLVSVLLAKDGTQAQIQIRLLNAAVRAGCKRFAPSQWANGLKSWERVSLMKMQADGVWESCQKHSDKIECALFNNGMFMNYFVIGAYPTEENVADDADAQLKRLRAGKGYMPGDDDACQGVDQEGDMPDGSGSWLLSLSTSTAQLPIRKDGEYPMITLTTIRDVGRFFARALDLPRWEKEMNIVGDTIRADKIVEVAEQITGKSVAVEKLTPEELESELQQLEMPDGMMKGLWLELKLGYTRDEEGDGVLRPVLNELCPNVKPVTVEEFLTAHWGQK